MARISLGKGELSWSVLGMTRLARGSFSTLFAVASSDAVSGYHVYCSNFLFIMGNCYAAWYRRICTVVRIHKKSRIVTSIAASALHT